MAESFNIEGVKKEMNNIQHSFDEFAQKLSEINEYINENINKSESSAVFGELGAKLLNLWNYNSATFGDFYSNFESWSAVVSLITANNYEFTEETIAKYKDNGGTLEGYKDPSKNEFSKQLAKVMAEKKKTQILEPKSDTKISINTAGIDPNSKVGKAIEKYKDDIQNAEYATISKDFFSITTVEKINGQQVEVTHVVLNNPDQINGAPANGAYGNGLEKSSNASKRLNAAYLINGSHFCSNGTQDFQGANYIGISNGKVVKDGVSGGAELLLYEDGTIGTARGVSAQQLVKNGVKYSFACHSTPVIQNGDISPSYAEGRLYKRTVIGQAGDCEYYIVTDNTYNNKLSNTAQYLLSKNCKNAYSLDQGGSVTLVRNDKVINNPSDSTGERPVADFVYFSERC